MAQQIAGKQSSVVLTGGCNGDYPICKDKSGFLSNESE